MSPPVTIAIVSWNTREPLEACLRSLAPEVDAGRAAAWVVDNASNDGSAELVRDRFGWARLIESGENLGYGRAVNLVASRTDSPWIIAANADVELTGGALAALLAAANRDDGAGALAPRLVLPDGRTQHSVYSFPTLGFTTLFNLGAQRVVPGLGDRLCLEGYWNPDRPRRVPWAIGALLLLRRTAWEEAGGFDERQWMYAEDLDLGWRLAQRGWSTRYVPDAVVRHSGGAATAQAFQDARKRWMESTYAWMRRRRGGGRTRAVALVNVLGAAARAALFGIAGRLWPGRFRRPSLDNREWMRLHMVGLRGGTDPDRHRGSINSRYRRS